MESLNELEDLAFQHIALQEHVENKEREFNEAVEELHVFEQQNSEINE